MGEVNLVDSNASTFPVIFDSGASLAISFNESDFIGSIRPLDNHQLGGLANGLKIEGIGTVHWKFRTKEGSIMTLISSAYYVPKAKARLLSPQRLFNAKKGVTGRFIVSEDSSTLQFDGVGEIVVAHDPGNHLPIALGKNKIPGVAEVNLSDVMHDNNTNLTPAQKLLLHWHCIFGHKSMSRVQQLLRVFPFLSERFKAS